MNHEASLAAAALRRDLTLELRAAYEKALNDSQDRAELDSIFRMVSDLIAEAAPEDVTIMLHA